MNVNLDRLLAPHRTRIRRAHFENVVARIQVGERDASLRAEVDPLIRQACHAIGEPVVPGGAEIQHAEIERYDAAAITERDAIQQPVRHSRLCRYAEHLDSGERKARCLGILGQAGRIENVEAARPAKRDAPVAQPAVRAERELLALQAVLAMKRLDVARLRIQSRQSSVAADPEIPDAAGTMP